MSRKPEGVSPRHKRGCPNTGRMEWGCGCPPAYQAQVWDRRTRKRGMTRTFTSEKTTRPLEAAIAWRDDQRAAIKARTATGSCPTVRVAALELIEGLKAGTVLNKSKEPYKPSVIRGYESSLLGHIVPAWGPARLDELTVEDIEAQANRWIAKGLSPSAVRNRLMPLRAVYRRAQRFDQVRSSPLDTAELPAVRDLKQRRYCSATEVAALLNACPAGDRALWATAFYTGLRRGELQALEVAHVDLDAAEIRVEWGWDRKEGRVKPKSRAGIRTVPIAKTLRPFLAEHLLQLSWRQGLIFGRKRDVPFVPERPGREAKDGVGGGEAQAGVVARLSPHVRVFDDRCGDAEHEGFERGYGPRLGFDHLGPLRKPPPRSVG
jgi:integrase